MSLLGKIEPTNGISSFIDNIHQKKMDVFKKLEYIHIYLNRYFKLPDDG